MTQEGLERRLTTSLHKQADQAEKYFRESGIRMRMRPPDRQSKWGLRRSPLIATAGVAAVALGLWIGSLVPRSDVGALPSPTPSATASSLPSAQPSPISTPEITPSPTTSPGTSQRGPENMAEVISGELVVYSEPSLQSSVVDRVAEGRVVWIASDQRSARDDWIRIQFASFAWSGQELFGWAQAGNRLRAVQLSCPTAEVASLSAMSAQERLDCFEGSDITLVGFAVQRADVASAYSGTPAWIAEPAALVLSGSDSSQADTGLLELHLDPASAITVSTNTWIEVRGHFDDRQARQCERRQTVDGLSVETPDEQAHYCRQRFVATQVQVVDRPVFPTPAPDG